MKEIVGNLWDEGPHHHPVWRCITTNGSVNRRGQCVMGRGCAKEATDLFPGLAVSIGDHITARGNHLFALPLIHIVGFPVKHHWREKADLKLIEQSAHELRDLAERECFDLFILPRPGCGYGQLTWEQVKPVIASILPDNVSVITFDASP